MFERGARAMLDKLGEDVNLRFHKKKIIVLQEPIAIPIPTTDSPN